MGKVELRSNEGDIDVVVDANVMNNIDDGIEDIEGKIEDMVDFLYRAFANFVANIGFEVGIEIVVHNLDSVHKDIASYWVDEASIVLLELHKKVALVLDLLHYPSGKLPSTLVMMGNIQ